MKKKIMYLDVARILATFAVIFIHAASSKPNWTSFGFETYEWNAFNFFTSCSRWAVPVFCMISGALFLDPDRKVDTKKLYTKNILRMIISYVFWSAFYIATRYESLRELTPAKIFKQFALGHYHMWFIFLIIGFYILVPVLRKITSDKNTLMYFTAISVIFTVVVPTLLLLPKLDWTSPAVSKMFMYMPVGYTCYFILGYVINKFEMKKWLKAAIYVLGPIAFAVTTIYTSLKSQETGKFNTDLNNYNTITVFLQTMFVFVVTKNIVEKIKFSPKAEKVLSTLSKDTFGIYFLHPFIILTLYRANLHTASFDPILSVIAVTLSTFIICEIVSHILNRIPIVKKYLV